MEVDGEGLTVLLIPLSLILSLKGDWVGLQVVVDAIKGLLKVGVLRAARGILGAAVPERLEDALRVRGDAGEQPDLRGTVESSTTLRMRAGKLRITSSARRVP